MFKLLTDDQTHEALMNAESVEKEEINIDHELESLLLKLEKFTETAAKKAELDEKTSFSTISIITIIAVLVAILAAQKITRGIISGLNSSIEVAKTVANGDLTKNIEVNSNDELGQLQNAMKSMQNSMRNMISALQLSLQLRLKNYLSFLIPLITVFITSKIKCSKPRRL